MHNEHRIQELYARLVHENRRLLAMLRAGYNLSEADKALVMGSRTTRSVFDASTSLAPASRARGSEGRRLLVG